MPTFATAVVLALLLSLLVARVHAGEDFSFCVSPSGDDKWSGKLTEPNAAKTDGPFATFARAQQAVRQLKADQPNRHGATVVQVRGGVYYLAEPIVFTPEDSGTANAPIVYTAAPNETPLLSGGTRLADWKRGEKERWRLEIPEVRDGKW